jgi:pimeloyl-ACP methyl ester carboxylesterase
MPTAHVNDVTLKYRIDGDGDDTVVLINGLADDLETWAYQTPALVEAGYRVLTFDNRGGLHLRHVDLQSMYPLNTCDLVSHLETVMMREAVSVPTRT